jgi:hypothetical protein
MFYTFSGDKRKTLVAKFRNITQKQNSSYRICVLGPDCVLKSEHISVYQFQKMGWFNASEFLRVIHLELSCPVLGAKSFFCVGSDALLCRL